MLSQIFINYGLLFNGRAGRGAWLAGPAGGRKLKMAVPITHPRLQPEYFFRSERFHVLMPFQKLSISESIPGDLKKKKIPCVKMTHVRLDWSLISPIFHRTIVYLAGNIPMLIFPRSKVWAYILKALKTNFFFFYFTFSLRVGLISHLKGIRCNHHF